jgi:hypothetical protein
MFFAVMAASLDYVRPELFDEAVDRHHRSHVSAVLGRPLGAIHCRPAERHRMVQARRRRPW